MAVNNQDKLDIIRAIFEINSATLALVNVLPDDIKVKTEEVIEHCSKAQAQLSKLLSRLEKDVDNG